MNDSSQEHRLDLSPSSHAARRRRLWPWILAALVVLALAGGGAAWYLTRPGPPVETSTTLTNQSAIPACEAGVNERLKAPGTAKFGGHVVRETAIDVVEVVGWVDAENGFGALVRNRFLCVAHRGQTGWRVSDVEFSDW